MRSDAGASLLRIGPGRDAGQPIVLLLHGGDGDPNSARVPALWPPYLRMIGFVPTLRRRAAGPTCYLLRNARKGWNDGGAGPVADAAWAIGLLRSRHSTSRIAVLAHSMGGRVAVRVISEPGVAGVVGLAPWLPAQEPVPDLTDRRAVLIHGADDTTIYVADTVAWAAKANRAATDVPVQAVTIPHVGHAMMRRFGLWNAIAADGVQRVIAGGNAD